MGYMIPPVEQLDYNEWNTPKEIFSIECFQTQILYRGKLYDEREWEMSDEKKDYDWNKSDEKRKYDLRVQRYYKKYKYSADKELPSQIDPDYKNKKIINECKELIEQSLNKPVEKTVYIDNSRRTKISIF